MGVGTSSRSAALFDCVRFEARKIPSSGETARMARVYSFKEYEQIPLELLLEDFNLEGFPEVYRTKLEYAFDEPGGFDNGWLPWQLKKEEHEP